MEIFRRDHILNTAPRHLASESHIRIQVVAITGQNFKELFDQYHGELLLICLKGSVSLKTKSASQNLEVGDQALLIDGEPFQAHPAHTDASDNLVQFIWTPGPNPCKHCFEQNKKFFAK